MGLSSKWVLLSRCVACVYVVELGASVWIHFIYYFFVVQNWRKKGTSPERNAISASVFVACGLWAYESGSIYYDFFLENNLKFFLFVTIFKPHTSLLLNIFNRSEYTLTASRFNCNYLLLLQKQNHLISIETGPTQCSAVNCAVADFFFSSLVLRRRRVSMRRFERLTSNIRTRRKKKKSRKFRFGTCWKLLHMVRYGVCHGGRQASNQIRLRRARCLSCVLLIGNEKDWTLFFLLNWCGRKQWHSTHSFIDNNCNNFITTLKRKVNRRALSGRNRSWNIFRLNARVSVILWKCVICSLARCDLNPKLDCSTMIMRVQRLLSAVIS